MIYYSSFYVPLKSSIHSFILVTLKVQRNPSGDFTKMYRHIYRGAWAFPTADHGWQVSDCTAEALKVENFGNKYE